jgi:hypothetical protein
VTVFALGTSHHRELHRGRSHDKPSKVRFFRGFGKSLAILLVFDFSPMASRSITRVARRRATRSTNTRGNVANRNFCHNTMAHVFFFSSSLFIPYNEQTKRTNSAHDDDETSDGHNAQYNDASSANDDHDGDSSDNDQRVSYRDFGDNDDDDDDDDDNDDDDNDDDNDDDHDDDDDIVVDSDSSSDSAPLPPPVASPGSTKAVGSNLLRSFCLMRCCCGAHLICVFVDVIVFLSLSLSLSRRFTCTERSTVSH